MTKINSLGQKMTITKWFMSNRQTSICSCAYWQSYNTQRPPFIAVSLMVAHPVTFLMFFTLVTVHKIWVMCAGFSREFSTTCFCWKSGLQLQADFAISVVTARSTISFTSLSGVVWHHPPGRDTIFCYLGSTVCLLSNNAIWISIGWMNIILCMQV